MKKSKLDKPGFKQGVIKRLALGESQSGIARDVGVNRSQISRFAGREDIKPFPEQELMNLLEAVPDAVENIKKLVREMKGIPKKDTKRLELAYKACLDTLRAGGIMASPVQSQIITNTYQQNNHFQSPLVQETIRKHTESLLNWKPEGWTEEDDKTL